MLTFNAIRLWGHDSNALLQAPQRSQKSPSRQQAAGRRAKRMRDPSAVDAPGGLHQPRSWPCEVINFPAPQLSSLAKMLRQMRPAMLVSSHSAWHMPLCDSRMRFCSRPRIRLALLFSSVTLATLFGRISSAEGRSLLRNRGHGTHLADWLEFVAAADVRPWRRVWRVVSVTGASFAVLGFGFALLSRGSV